MRLVSRLEMTGALPLLYHTPLCRAEGQFLPLTDNSIAVMFTFPVTCFIPYF